MHDFRFRICGRRVLRVQGLLFCGAVVLAILLGWCSLLPAAPVTFRFDAEISEVQGDVVALNLPFPLEVGLSFTGQYEFQSEQHLLNLVAGLPTNEALVRLFIGNSELLAATNFGILNDGGPKDINGPPTVPSSSISLGYFSLTDVFPPDLGGRRGVAGVGLTLVGPLGVLSVPEDILSVAVWNELTILRQLGLNFDRLGTVSARATIGNFVEVPEPSSMQLFAAILMGIGCYRLYFTERNKEFHRKRAFNVFPWS